MITMSGSGSVPASSYFEMDPFVSDAGESVLPNLLSIDSTAWLMSLSMLARRQDSREAYAPGSHGRGPSRSSAMGRSAKPAGSPPPGVDPPRARYAPRQVSRRILHKA